MKQRPLSLLLVALFALAALSTLALSVRYAWLVRRVQNLQAQAAVAQRDRNLVLTLANDAFEYGKRNPAILPVLETIGIRLRTAATNQPPLTSGGR
jgi:Tfp pilus assembly protein PilX